MADNSFTITLSSEQSAHAYVFGGFVVDVKIRPAVNLNQATGQQLKITVEKVPSSVESLNNDTNLPSISSKSQPKDDVTSSEEKLKIDREREITAALMKLSVTKTHLSKETIIENIIILERHGVPPVCKNNGEYITYKYGDIYHRRDGPAHIRIANGKIAFMAWFLYDDYWCDGHPSEIYSDGNFEYKIGLKNHNPNGVAMRRGEYDYWYYNGKIHRWFYPAVCQYDGNKIIKAQWYEHDNCIKTMKIGDKNWDAMFGNWQRPPPPNMDQYYKLQ